MVERAEDFSGLCAPCWQKWKSWLGYIYRPDPQIISIGRPLSAAEQGKKNFEIWLGRVRENQNLIIHICANRHQGLEEAA